MTTDMTRTQRQLIDALVPEMIAYLAARGIDVAGLAADPSSAILAIDDIELRWVEPDTLTGACSVAGLYMPLEQPPLILVARDLSAGRRAFSTLHELGHHLCTQIDSVMQVFWDLPEGGKEVEEYLVDEFAAAVLLPPASLSEAFSAGVDASAVIRLSHTSSASREACCVAAARALPAPGYVMLLEPDGRCRFAARHGDVFAVGRDTLQHATKLRPALRGGTARGVDRPAVSSGVAVGEMHFDAAADGDYVFVVWVTDTPAWGALPIPLNDAPVGHTGYCGNCDQEFTSWKTPCGRCEEPQCPKCGSCECEPGTLRRAATRRCDSCFLDLPLQEFDGNSTTCMNH